MSSPEQPVLLLGVNGQVGFELARSLQGLGNVRALDRAALDLSDFDQVRRVIRETNPRWIVNAAAYTAVDKAESEPDAAMRLNAELPAVLAEAARTLGAALVHYSTDYVFDGAREGAYVETDATHPQNVYGLSKLAGEQVIEGSGCAHLIFRTSWVYGNRGKNFLLTMLRLGAERDELNVVADQVGAPTWCRTIAVLTANILAQASASRDSVQWWQEHSGVYHLSAGGLTSWHGFAEAIFETSEMARKPTVHAIQSSAYPLPAKRPTNSQLSNQKLAKAFGVCAPDWRAALRLCMTERMPTVG